MTELANTVLSGGAEGVRLAGTPAELLFGHGIGPVHPLDGFGRKRHDLKYAALDNS